MIVVILVYFIYSREETQSNFWIFKVARTNSVREPLVSLNWTYDVGG
jgi:hypothetical protein